MEAPDPGTRQSGPSSATISDSHPAPHRPYGQPQHSYASTPDRSHRELPAMATASVLPPTASYPPQPAYSGYNPTQPAGSMISSAEPRRSSEDKDSAGRQSLPSISELPCISSVMSKHSSTYSPLGPEPIANKAFPSSFATTPRPMGESEKGASPQSHRPPPTFPRQEPLPPFHDSPRTSLNGRPGLPALPARRNSPPVKSEYSHPYSNEPPKDPRGLNGVHPQQYTAQLPPASNSYPTGSLPHGQMPLPSYPSSPHHRSSNSYGTYEQRGQPSHHEDDPRAPRTSYEPAMYTSPWNYGESLGRLASTSRTIYTFAEGWGRIAQEQHGIHPLAERLPSEQECNEMASNTEMLKAALDRIREVVRHSARNERAREPPKQKAPYEDEQDVSMYEDGMKAAYTMPPEVKKRRGRAAPPGRCHSCNRVDTPEWRRGPDGARTLCNACGLHYAKLERKRQLEQRSIRPKPEDRP